MIWQKELNNKYLTFQAFFATMTLKLKDTDFELKNVSHHLFSPVCFNLQMLCSYCQLAENTFRV